MAGIISIRTFCSTIQYTFTNASNTKEDVLCLLHRQGSCNKQNHHRVYIDRSIRMTIWTNSYCLGKHKWASSERLCRFFYISLHCAKQNPHSVCAIMHWV
ncbi:unnamed protein product [Albugo candida]|uniref:Uncharacterized protein n=1 Tax=Albugo candida TaxID=65357 RepID=A0A024GHG7_9STRA|nr:unnamed protein product [Albugo candida]|eukprot:CCI45921.1 unnamed protein product [Albugo candida]